MSLMTVEEATVRYGSAVAAQRAGLQGLSAPLIFES